MQDRYILNATKSCGIEPDNRITHLSESMVHFCLPVQIFPDWFAQHQKSILTNFVKATSDYKYLATDRTRRIQEAARVGEVIPHELQSGLWQ